MDTLVNRDYYRIIIDITVIILPTSLLNIFASMNIICVV